MHFWSDVVSTKLVSGSTFLYEVEMGLLAHRLTADQLAFIVMHELGHVALDHPRRLKSQQGSGDVAATRHEFEYAADSFALDLLRFATE